jgi:hypothetical protein
MNGGAPARLRSLVGSALGSLSRLRRAPGSEDHARVEAPPHMNVRPWDEPDSLALTDLDAAPEPPRVDASANGAVAADAAVPAEAEPIRGEATAAIEPATPVQAELPKPAAAAPAVKAAAVKAAPVFEPCLLDAAHLCTALARVECAGDVEPLLQEAARIIGAIGLVLWVWDPDASQLRPALAHGYSEKVLAQLPPLTADTDNATAAAFRSCQTCVIAGSERSSGALVVPLLAAGGCSGVLAIELQHGHERSDSVRAVATIIAAQLASLIGGARAAEPEPVHGDMVVDDAPMHDTRAFAAAARI